MTTPRHRRPTVLRRQRLAVGLTVPALLILSSAAVAATDRRDSPATGAGASSSSLTELQAVARSGDRSSRSTDRRTLTPSVGTPASAGAVTADASAKSAQAHLDAAVEAKRRAAKEKAAAEKKALAKAAAQKKAEAKKAAQAVAHAEVVGRRYATAALSLRTSPSVEAKQIDVLDDGARVSLTDLTTDHWALVKVDDSTGWVHSAYLSRDKPTIATTDATTNHSSSSGASGGFSSAACAGGSSVESGLASNATKVHRAVCAAFPSVGAYGGLGGGGNHATGHALDIMIGSSSALGSSIAAWARANASALGISEVIWSQHIWTVQRSSEGWRPMPDRGSATANHYDHVHVSVY